MTKYIQREVERDAQGNANLHHAPHTPTFNSQKPKPLTSKRRVACAMLAHCLSAIIPRRVTSVSQVLTTPQGSCKSGFELGVKNRNLVTKKHFIYDFLISVTDMLSLLVSSPCPLSCHPPPPPRGWGGGDGSKEWGRQGLAGRGIRDGGGEAPICVALSVRFK